MAKKDTGKSKKTGKIKASAQAATKSKRNTKDSVFTHLFSFPEYQLKLYQALHPDDKDVSEADIKTITRDCVVGTHEHNDLGILVKDRLMLFVEAQSSWSPNIVIRLLSYAVQSLMDYFRSKSMATRHKRFSKHSASAETKTFSLNILKNWRVKLWIL